MGTTALIDYTQNQYHEIRHAEFLDSDELRLAWGEVAERLYFSELRSGDRVLEFGGGLGVNLLSIARRWETWMVEPAPIGRDLAVRAGIHACASLEAIDPAICFNYVLCRHCLEHLEQPLETLRALRGRMRPGARLVLVLPVESPELMPAADDIDHHLYAWNPRTIVNLLGCVGFVEAAVRFDFFNGRRRLLPLRRLFGARAYWLAGRLLGRATDAREMVITANA